jgi:hypothetical protein
MTIKDPVIIQVTEEAYLEMRENIRKNNEEMSQVKDDLSEIKSDIKLIRQDSKNNARWQMIANSITWSAIGFLIALYIEHIRG